MAAGRPKTDWVDELARRIVIAGIVTAILDKQKGRKSLMRAYEAATTHPTLAGYNLGSDTIRREYEAARSGRDVRIDRQRRAAKYERRKARIGEK